MVLFILRIGDDSYPFIVNSQGPPPKPPFDSPYLVREPTVEEYMKRADCRLIPENANPKKKTLHDPML